MNSTSDQFDEYKLPGDEKQKPQKFEKEKLDTSEYMMVPGRKLTMSTHEYYSQGGYAYGKRKKK